MKRKALISVAFTVCICMLGQGCGKSDSKWEKLKKQRAEERKESLQKQAPDVSSQQHTKAVLKVAAAKSAFAGQGWQSDAREKGKEIKGEIMYKVTEGQHSFRAAVQASSDNAENLERVTVYITGPHIQLQSVEQFPPKLIDTLNSISPLFKKGFSKALGDMRSLTSRGTPRRVGTGYLSGEGWKCVVVNYINEQKNGQPYMIIAEKI